MKRKTLIKVLSDAILFIQKDSPILVGIDGVDASGKTFLANEVAKELEQREQKVIRASIDGFHNSEDIRYRKGKDSPEGYYYDSFNYEALVKFLLKPLSAGRLQYKKATFDYRTNSGIDSGYEQANRDSILIMEGVFMFRPEIVNYWDLKILLDVDFKETVQRATERTGEKENIGEKQKIIEKYKLRYVPGQKVYFRESRPEEKAGIIIDNTDFANPIIVKNNRE